MSESRVSVIIPVRNGATKISKCLEVIFAQSLKPYEIIVVDGHSDDGTVETIEEFPVTLLFENHHTRAGACQVGVEYATGEYVAFTDADCIPASDWLDTLAKGFEHGIVGVGGAVKNVGDDFWTRSIHLSYNTFLGSASSVQGRAFNDVRYVNSISGCNSMYRRADILDTGGFNVRLPGAEDAEFNGRLGKRGKLLYRPEVILPHDHGRGLEAFAK